MHTGEYLVDAWSAIEEARLTYIRHNQNSDPDEDEYIGTGDEEPVEDVCLPSTFVHSPAWSAANISDCLALRKAFGPVTLFITFTTNPRCPKSFPSYDPVSRPMTDQISSYASSNNISRLSCEIFVYSSAKSYTIYG
jgi:hypothetical protein